MTNEQINISIAEAGGWTIDERIPLKAKESVTGRWIPDYCNDLNAMHEAEKMLNDEQMAKYAFELDKAFPPDQQDMFAFSRAYCFVHATAKQRAEAFLRTLKKWEE